MAENTGVTKTDAQDLRVKLENNELDIEGPISYSPYEKLNPVYTEVSIGKYARKFTVSHAVDTRKH